MSRLEDALEQAKEWGEGLAAAQEELQARACAPATHKRSEAPAGLPQLSWDFLDRASDDVQMLGRGSFGKVLGGTLSWAVKLDACGGHGGLPEEASISAAVVGEHVAGALAWVRSDDGSQTGFLMPRAERCLHDALWSGPESSLDSAARVGLLRHMLAGIGSMHARDYAHMDLKPANMLLFKLAGGRWVLRLGDLGLAVRISAADQLTGWRGTWAYAAPFLLFKPCLVVAADRWGAFASSFDPFCGDTAGGALKRQFHALPPGVDVLLRAQLERWMPGEAPTADTVLMAAHHLGLLSLPLAVAEAVMRGRAAADVPRVLDALYVGLDGASWADGASPDLQAFDAELAATQRALQAPNPPTLQPADVAMWAGRAKAKRAQTLQALEAFVACVQSQLASEREAVPAASAPAQRRKQLKVVRRPGMLQQVASAAGQQQQGLGTARQGALPNAPPASPQQQQQQDGGVLLAGQQEALAAFGAQPSSGEDGVAGALAPAGVPPDAVEDPAAEGDPPQAEDAPSEQEATSVCDSTASFLALAQSGSGATP